jgi:hypothetical protein
MNSDTLNLEGERRRLMRRERCRGTAVAVGCPLQTACKGRGIASGNRCAQPQMRSPIHPRAAVRSFRRMPPLARERRKLPLPSFSFGNNRGFWASEDEAKACLAKEASVDSIGRRQCRGVQAEGGLGVEAGPEVDRQQLTTVTIVTVVVVLRPPCLLPPVR